MKARKVHESIDFKRSEDPYKSLDVGIKKDYRVSWYRNSNQVDQKIYKDMVLDDVRAIAQKHLRWMYSGSNMPSESKWATICVYDEDYHSVFKWRELLEERMKLMVDENGWAIRDENGIIQIKNNFLNER